MDLIHVDNAKYDHYEALLLRRDRLRKEAHILQACYMQEFGALILDSFREKMNCIRKKKQIAYCQMAISCGRDVNAAEMEDYLAEQMRSYEMQLQQLAAEHDVAQHMERVSPVIVSQIKRLYHRLAKQLHPDINPMTEQVPVLRDLWQDVVAAYNANDLEELKETDILVQRALEELELGHLEIEIPDIEDRIRAVEEDILQIKSTNPYLYQQILDDPSAVADKKKELQDELEEYRRYSTELSNILEQLIITGGLTFTWTMN